MAEQAELLQGTLDLLVLKTLTLGPLHGWGISKRIRDLSREAFAIGQGSLYPALYRLEDRGFIESSWAISSEGKRAKFYTLTRLGRQQFAKSRQEWTLFQTAIGRVLSAT
jgi:PadR family transcriptional regulator, regulatory protein PadR